MINQVVLVGRLTRDPELRTAKSGISITSFTLAVTSKQKKEDGTRGTCYIGCVAFKQSAETVCKYARKGSMIGVAGSLNERKYERNDGTKASVIEVMCDSVTLLEKKGAGHDDIPPFDVPANDDSQVTETNDSVDTESLDIPSDDDLPF